MWAAPRAAAGVEEGRERKGAEKQTRSAGSQTRSRSNSSFGEAGGEWASRGLREARAGLSARLSKVGLVLLDPRGDAAGGLESRGRVGEDGGLEDVEGR